MRSGVPILSEAIHIRVVIDIRASVAQLVELLICNQWVGGSSPSAGSMLRGGVPEWSKGTDCKSVGNAFGGSNPPPTTSLNTGRLQEILV